VRVSLEITKAVRLLNDILRAAQSDWLWMFTAFQFDRPEI